MERNMRFFLDDYQRFGQCIALMYCHMDIASLLSETL